MKEHIYIEVSEHDFFKEYARLKPFFDEATFHCEVPNSLGGPRHNQFSISIGRHRVTIWNNVEKL